MLATALASSVQKSGINPGANVRLGKCPCLAPGEYGVSGSASLGGEGQERTNRK